MPASGRAGAAQQAAGMAACWVRLVGESAQAVRRRRTSASSPPKVSRLSVAGSGVNTLSGDVPSPNVNDGEMSDSEKPLTPEKVKVRGPLTSSRSFKLAVVTSPV